MVRDVAAVIWGSRRYFVPVPTCPLRMLCTGGLAAVGLAQSDNLAGTVRARARLEAGERRLGMEGCGKSW